MESIVFPLRATAGSIGLPMVEGLIIQAFCPNASPRYPQWGDPGNHHHGPADTSKTGFTGIAELFQTETLERSLAPATAIPGSAGILPVFAPCEASAPRDADPLHPTSNSPAGCRRSQAAATSVGSSCDVQPGECWRPAGPAMLL